MEIKYKASETLSRFAKDESFYRGVRGPVGSGKSSACCMELFRRAVQQAPGRDGVRRSRWAVARNVYRELKDTTIKTWMNWFPAEHFGTFHESSMTYSMAFDLGTEKVEMEIMFRALDRPDDAKKLLSLELTGAWVNEAKEVPKGIIDTLGDRVGRFPAVKDGGCTWSGVIMDTNSPDEDHWWYRLAEEERPENWAFFAQPGGLLEKDESFILNPKAENTENLPQDYYVRNIAGKDRDHVRVYYCNQYGFVSDGKPIYNAYSDATHASDTVLDPMKNIPIFIGIDFGLTPAAIIGQNLPNGKWIVLDELVTEDMGSLRFGKLLKLKLEQEYGSFEFKIYGDPAGEQRAQTDERTPFQILEAVGIKASKAPTNDFSLRVESVNSVCGRMIDGEPGFVISPKCKILRKAMAGGYSYKRMQVSGDERFQDKPDKNKYSHPAEALQYMLLGAGENNKVLGYTEEKDPGFLPHEYAQAVNDMFSP